MTIGRPDSLSPFPPFLFLPFLPSSLSSLDNDGDQRGPSLPAGRRLGSEGPGRLRLELGWARTPLVGGTCLKPLPPSPQNENSNELQKFLNSFVFGATFFVFNSVFARILKSFFFLNQIGESDSKSSPTNTCGFESSFGLSRAWACVRV